MWLGLVTATVLLGHLLLHTPHNQVAHMPMTQVLYWESTQRGQQLAFANGQYLDGQPQKFLPLTGLCRGCLADRRH